MPSAKKTHSTSQRKSPKPKPRSSSSSRPKSKHASTPRTSSCCLCGLKPPNACHLTHSLYRKYSSSQNHHYLTAFNSLVTNPEQLQLEE